tara:strand:- start:497 stop:2746 length:2250 start_codon:yes stop_codon:yes gene_type:complete
MADGILMRMKADASQAIGELKKLGGANRELTGGEKKLMGALAGVAAATAYAMKQAINYGDWLEKTSQKVGVSTETLSAYKLGAELAGTSQEGLVSGLQRLQKNMGAALRSPTSAAAVAFKNLGVAFQNADGSFRDVGEMLPEISDKMAGMADGTMKTQIAMDLMGRQGAELIPFLNQGADALEAMRQESEELGVVWTQEDALAAAEFNDAVTRLKATLDGMVQRATKFYLPAMLDFANGAVLAARAVLRLDLEERRRAKGLDDTRGILNDYVDKTDAYTRILETTLAAEKKMESRVWTDALYKDMQIVAAAAMEVGIYKDATGELAEARDKVGSAIMSEALQQDAGQSRIWREENDKAILTLFRHAQGLDDVNQILKERKARFKELRAEMAGEAGILSKSAMTLKELAETRGKDSEATEGQAKAAKKAKKGMTEAEKAAAQLGRALELSSGEVVNLQRAMELMGMKGEEAIRTRAIHAISDLETEMGRVKAAATAANQALTDALTKSLEDQVALTREAADKEIEIFREKEAMKTSEGEKSSESRVMTEEESVSAAIGSMQGSMTAFQDFSAMTAQIVSDVYGEGSKEAQDALKALFVVNKSVALANAIVNTALSITNALTIMPTPLGIAMAVVAGIAGAVQIAAIVGTTIAGLADAGIPPDALRRAGLNQHSLIAMRNDEMVLDPTGTRHISEMLEMQKNGAMGQMAEVSTVIEIDGHVLGEVVDRHLIRSAERGHAYGSRIRYGERMR